MVLVDPPSGTFGVGLNVTPHITFSEPVNGLTIPGALVLAITTTGRDHPRHGNGFGKPLECDIDAQRAASAEYLLQRKPLL